MAKADEFTGDLFRSLNLKVYYGNNPMKGSACTLTFDNATLYYSFNDHFSSEDITRSKTEANAKHLNSIGAGHFFKRIFRSAVIAKMGGGLSFSCIMGNCSSDSLELKYDGDKRPTALIFSFASSPNQDLNVQDICEIDPE